MGSNTKDPNACYLDSKGNHTCGQHNCCTKDCNPFSDEDQWQFIPNLEQDGTSMCIDWKGGCNGACPMN